MPLTAAQRRALTLIGSGGYRYHEPTGSVRHRNHRPGTPLVYRATMVVLVRDGYARYSDWYHGLAELTDRGRAALTETR